jgi:peroxiredoxin
MTAYQAGIAKLEAAGAAVIGISTDNLPAQKYWAENVLKLSFPLGSDFQRKVTAAYGVLNPASGTASRTTFVVDSSGVIQHIEEGQDALKTDGTVTACSRLHGK